MASSAACDRELLVVGAADIRGYNGGMWRTPMWIALATLGCGRVAFDPAPAPLGEAHYRKPIQIDGARVVGGPHAHFPVLIQLASAPDLAAHARADGFDIRFATAAGENLAYERESYDPATGALTAWVQLPVLGSAGATFDLLYGDPEAADQQQPQAVWDASFEAVWHFAGTTLDSTSHHDDGTPHGGLAFGAAPIGQGLAFDGIDAYLSVAKSAGLSATASAGTFSLWIRWNVSAGGNYQMMMSSSNQFVTPRDGFEWANQPDGHHYFYPWGGTETDFAYYSDPFTDGIWQHLAVTLDDATKTVVVYVDGAAITPLQNVAWLQVAQPDDWLWGGNPAMGGPDWFLGGMDEIRVESAVRSAGWLATEVANQRSPATFFSVGAETTAP